MSTSKASSSKPVPASDSCVICFSEFEVFDESDSFGTTECDHWSCKNCSQKYFQNYVKKPSFHSYNNIECPSLGCKKQFEDLVLSDIFFDIFTNEEERAWWNTVLTRTYILCRFAVLWVPVVLYLMQMFRNYKIAPLRSAMNAIVGFV